MGDKSKAASSHVPTSAQSIEVITKNKRKNNEEDKTTRININT